MPLACILFGKSSQTSDTEALLSGRQHERLPVRQLLVSCTGRAFSSRVSPVTRDLVINRSVASNRRVRTPCRELRLKDKPFVDGVMEAKQRVHELVEDLLGDSAPKSCSWSKYFAVVGQAQALDLTPLLYDSRKGQLTTKGQLKAAFHIRPFSNTMSPQEILNLPDEHINRLSLVVTLDCHPRTSHATAAFNYKGYFQSEFFFNPFGDNGDKAWLLPLHRGVFEDIAAAAVAQNCTDFFALFPTVMVSVSNEELTKTWDYVDFDAWPESE